MPKKQESMIKFHLQYAGLTVIVGIVASLVVRLFTVMYSVIDVMSGVSVSEVAASVDNQTQIAHWCGILAGSVIVWRWVGDAKDTRQFRKWYTDPTYPESIRYLLNTVEGHANQPMPNSITQLYDAIQENKKENESAVLYAAGTALSSKAFKRALSLLSAILDRKQYTAISVLENDEAMNNAVLKPLAEAAASFQEALESHRSVHQPTAVLEHIEQLSQGDEKEHITIKDAFTKEDFESDPEKPWRSTWDFHIYESMCTFFISIFAVAAALIPATIITVIEYILVTGKGLTDLTKADGDTIAGIVLGIAAVVAIITSSVCIKEWRGRLKVHRQHRVWYEDDMYPTSIRSILEFVEKHADDPQPQSLIDIYGMIHQHKLTNEKAVRYAAAQSLMSDEFIDAFSNLVSIFDDPHYLRLYKEEQEEMDIDPVVQQTIIAPLNAVKQSFKKRLEEYLNIEVRSKKHQLHELLSKEFTTLVD